MNKQLSKRTYIICSLVLMTILIALDRITKIAALKFLKDQDPIVLIEGVFELNYLENRGIAFGLLENQRIPILIIVIIILFAMGYCFYKLPVSKRYMPLHLILIAVGAGALGNMTDRIVYGFVVDFFYFSLIDFPVFNVADIYVTVSAFMIFLLILFYYKEEDIAFLSKSIKIKKQTDTGDQHEQP